MIHSLFYGAVLGLFVWSVDKDDLLPQRPYLAVLLILQIIGLILEFSGL